MGRLASSLVLAALLCASCAPTSMTPTPLTQMARLSATDWIPAGGGTVGVHSVVFFSSQSTSQVSRCDTALSNAGASGMQGCFVTSYYSGGAVTDWAPAGVSDAGSTHIYVYFASLSSRQVVRCDSAVSNSSSLGAMTCGSPVTFASLILPPGVHMPVPCGNSSHGGEGIPCPDPSARRPA